MPFCASPCAGCMGRRHFFFPPDFIQSSARIRAASQRVERLFCHRYRRKMQARENVISPLLRNMVRDTIISAWRDEKVGHHTQHVRVVDHAQVTDPVDLDVTVTSRFLSQASLPRNHAVGL